MRNIILGLLECSAMASIVMLAVVLVRSAFGRRLASAVLLALWALALARLLLPMALPSPVHMDALLPRPAAMVSLPTANTVPIAPVAAMDTGAFPNNGTLPVHQPQAMPPASTVPAIQLRWWNRLDLWACGTLLWAAGAAITVLLALLRGRRLRRAVLLCQPVCDTAILAMVDALRAELRMRIPVRVLRCAFAATPMVYGVRRPALLLPPEYLASDAIALRGVLLHELSHIRRQDLLWERLWLLARAAHWFNPLVHLACRLRRDDVELACDALALRQMDVPARLGYGEALLNAARGQNSRRLRTAAALLGSSSVARRLRALAAPWKPSRIGATLCGVLAMVLVAGCFTTACQPTPAKPAVVGKNDGKLEEKLKETATPAATATGADTDPSATPVKVTLRSRMNIPETWQYEKTGDNGAVKVHVDATIEVPDVSAAAVYRAKVQPFTLEQIQKIHQTLMGNAQLYEIPGPNRDYWLKSIAAAKEAIADAKKNGTKEWLKKMESELAYAQDNYAKTPENPERKPAELAFTKETPQRPEADYIGVTATVDGQDMTMVVGNGSPWNMIRVGRTNTDGYPMSPEYYSIDPNPDAPEGVTMTREQALQRATEMAAQIDADMMPISIGAATCNDSSKGQVWMVTCSRVLKGMPSIDYTHHLSEEFAENDNPDYEHMQIGLDDKGVVCFIWGVQTPASETVNTDAALKSLPEIQDAVAQALYRNVQGGQKTGQKSGQKSGAASQGIQVGRMVLGLVRVAYKDHPGEFLLMPAWDIYGTMQTYRPLLTVNAVDGSIIDTTKGY